MVDFNNETTISTPSYDVVKILILQRRYDLMEAIEHFKKQENSGLDNIDVYLPYIRTRLLSLYLELYPMIMRKKNKVYITDLEEGINSQDYEELLGMVKKLLIFIDDLKITAIDTKRKIDTTRIEKVNQYKGL